MVFKFEELGEKVYLLFFIVIKVDFARRTFVSFRFPALLLLHALFCTFIDVLL